jgi:hypothetical protein
MTKPPFTQQQFALKTLSVALGFVGTDRKGDRAQVTKFLNLFGLPFADPSTGKPYAFCAAGLSYASVKAWSFLSEPQLPTDMEQLKKNVGKVWDFSFRPSTRCSETIADAEKRGNLLLTKRKDTDGEHVAPKGYAWQGKVLVPVKEAYIVFFDWGTNPTLGKTDHVEIVYDVHSNNLKNVGFNTSDEDFSNGGAVCVKPRPYDHVTAYIKTY